MYIHKLLRTAVTLLVLLVLSIVGDPRGHAAALPDGSPAVTGWLQTGYDSSHTGFNPTETTLTTSNVTNLARVWHAGSDRRYSNPVIANGMVILTTRAKNKCTTVKALHASTGELIWSIGVGPGYGQCTNPAISGNIVSYTTNNPSSLVAYTISGSGGRGRSLPQATYSGLTAANNMFYYDAGNGWVYAINAKTLKPVWSHNTTSKLVDVSPAVRGQTVYVNAADGKVFAIRATDGKGMWTTSIAASPAVGATTLAVADNMLFVSDGPDNLYSLDTAHQGKMVWKVTNGGYNSDFAVAYHMLFITAPPQGPHGQGPSVFALNDKTGKPMWQFTTGYVGAKPSVANHIVYVSNNGVGSASKIFALNAKTGAKLWSARGVGPYPSYPAIAGGRLFINNYAFGLP